jgi:hypothetical protein
MGLLSWFLESGNRHRKLDQGSTAAQRLKDLELALRALLRRTRDRIEIVPGEGRAFAFIGRPPAQFQFFWIEGGSVRGLNEFVEEHGLDASTERALRAALAQAHERSLGAPRYRARVAGRRILVVPWPQLAMEVETILERGAHPHQGSDPGQRAEDPRPPDLLTCA